MVVYGALLFMECYVGECWHNVEDHVLLSVSLCMERVPARSTWLPLILRQSVKHYQVVRRCLLSSVKHWRLCVLHLELMPR